MKTKESRMKVKYPVYDDDVISVSLVAEDLESTKKDLFYIAIRGYHPGPIRIRKEEI